MKDSENEPSKWKLERQQGSLRFVVRTSFPAILGVMVGQSIEPAFISETVWGWAQTTDIFMSGFWGSIGAIPFSLLIWWWRERKYQYHIAKFE
ncbi:hypothetical protein [Photobacterium sp. 1_MG-2023]|uniref:hypothetical protein n=1 Tax=Photobacterium sp. 1_MG-2023 TaxID=3062646 RepID=UPI0026E4328E|nr:hypothetical protein [Photobacterium sp. 1_MG-2023]MDO6709023.1 hypothetical protein [Photobacterium sp. 1_MG-2023]